jgi:di/tricarboxylate transporter
MVTIGALFIVVGVVEKSYLINHFSRKMFGTSGAVWLGKLRVFTTCFFLSIFFNNTPLVTILVPILKDWGRMRNVPVSELLMPLSYSVIAGSFVAMIGTSTNITIQGLMEADRGSSFPLFAPAYVGIPLFIVLVFYLVFAGPYILPRNKYGLLLEARDNTRNLIAEVFVSTKSVFVGKSLRYMMGSLGLPPSKAVKIRRKVHPSQDDESRDNSVAIKNNSDYPFTPIPLTAKFDDDYVNRMKNFWNSPRATESERTKDASTSVSHSSLHEPSSEGDFEYVDVIAPQPQEIILAEDVIFVSSATELVAKMMKSIAGESKGLYILESNVLSLPGFGSELLECVVSDTNPFLGRKVSEIKTEFAERYNAGLITIRSKNPDENSGSSSVDGASVRGTIHSEPHLFSPESKSLDEFDAVEMSTPLTSASQRERSTSMDTYHETRRGTVTSLPSIVEEGFVDFTIKNHRDLFGDCSSSSTMSAEDNIQNGNEEKSLFAEVSVSDHILTYGDIILCVTNESEVPRLTKCGDFFVVSSVGALPKPINYFTLIPCIFFAVLFALVGANVINMTVGSLALVALYFLGGWLKGSEVPEMIDFRVLMSIACSISYARAIIKTGLAASVASTLKVAAHNNFSGMMLVYCLTLAITELVTNNAAAAVMYPVAVAMADQLGSDYKPYVMNVLIASTASFMSPFGYQTHVMVWAPGGYRAIDFFLFGFFPDLLYLFGACLIIPSVYPH